MCFSDFYLGLVSLPCVRSTQGKKPPALRVDDTDAMQQNSFPSRMVIVQVADREGKENTMAQKANSLAHTKWMCKYHIVFCPKYRRKAIYNQYREDLGQIFRQLCQWKGVEIIEGHLMPDPRPHIGKHPAQDCRVKLYGIAREQKLAAHVRQACEPQVQVRESEVLGRGLLCVDCGIE